MRKSDWYNNVSSFGSILNCKKIPDREVKIVYQGINGTQTFSLKSGSIFIRDIILIV